MPAERLPPPNEYHSSPLPPAPRPTAQQPGPAALKLEPKPEPKPVPLGPPLRCSEEPGRGWCYRATRELEAGTPLLCSAPDVAAMYTDHTATVCASCFERPKALRQCDGCKRFALCAGCDEGGALRRWHEADECAAFQRIPEGMRNGDTDYLRFVLRYLAARRRGMPPVPARAAAPGGSGAADAFPDLCSNMDVQTDSFKEFAANFAALFAQHVDFPPNVDVREVELLLAKIRANSLGFPFTPDGATTLGWCLHSAASRFNHSCAPNCCVVAAPPGEKAGALLVQTKQVRAHPCSSPLLHTACDDIKFNPFD